MKFNEDTYLYPHVVEEEENTLTTIVIDSTMLIVYILIGTAFFLIIPKIIKSSHKQTIIFKVIEILVFVMTGFFFIYGLFLYFMPPREASIFSALLTIALALRRIIKGDIRNIIGGMSAGGAAILLGLSFPFQIIVVFSILLILYDVISVFITKHMVELANIVLKNQLAMVLSIEEKEKNISNVEVLKKGISNRISLGTGDLLVPSTMAVSLIPIKLSIIYVLFSFIGFIVMVWMLNKLKRPLPALLPIMGTSLTLLFLYMYLNPVS